MVAQGTRRRLSAWCNLRWDDIDCRKGTIRWRPEMSPMAGPAGLTAALAAAGFRKEDFPRLARAVLEYLRPAIGSANIQKFLADMPALQG